MYQEVLEEIQALVKEEQGGMHTALPGIIMSYDPNTGTATIIPKCKLRVSDDRILDYPQLNDVHIVFPFCSALAAGVAYPVREGDSCLVILCEQALDSWLGTGDTNVELQYSLTNAIAIPGLMKFATEESIEANKEDAVLLYNGKSKIKIKSDVIEISGNVKINGNLNVSGKINE